MTAAGYAYRKMDAAEIAGRPTAKAVRDARSTIAPKTETTRPRSALPDQYARAIHELDKVTRKLGELTRDDRFRRHRGGGQDLHRCDNQDVQ